MTAASSDRPPIEDLLDRAIAALNEGEVDRARGLASEILAADADHLDAGDLLAAESRPEGEIRRLTVMFCDLVGSTELSARLEPEAYRATVVRYQTLCRSIVEDRYDGSIVAVRGDGVLASFGFPTAHENDVDRAVLAGLDLLEEMRRLEPDPRAGEPIRARVAVHKGLVYLDRGSKELYGFAVNVAARLEALAEVGTVLVSDEVSRLLRDRFDLEPHPPRRVKGVATPIATHTVLGPRRDDGALRARAPLVGRDDDLEIARTAWERVRLGERVAGECLAIIGEAGIGKSRVAAALVHEARADGATAMTLHGSPLHAAIGLWPVRSLIEELCGITRHTDAVERLDRLRTVLHDRGLDGSVPLLAALLGLDPAAGYEPDPSDARQLRERIGDAAIDVLRSGFGAGGSVLLVEDMHWCDDETRDVVRRLIRGADPDLLVVLTTRDPATAPRGDRVHAIRLEALEVPDRLALLRHLGGDVLEDGQLADLADKSDGIPIYLEELVRAALEPGAAAPAPAAIALPADPAVPEVLYEGLVARLQGATKGMTLAATAAAIGRESDHDLLARVSELDPVEFDEALRDLLGALILERAGPDRDRYRFRHELVRAVAYDLQPPSRRRDLHGRVADALVADGVDADAIDWALVASHYETAGRRGAAGEALERAATVARRRGALVEARSLLGRAIEAVAGADGLVEREVDLRLQRAFLAVSLEGNSSAEAAADYERCLELSLPVAGSDGMFATLNALWSYYSARGDFDRADELLAVLGQTGGRFEGAARFLSTAGRALTATYRGNFGDGIALAEEAILLFAALDSRDDYDRWWFVPLDPSAITHTLLAVTRTMCGDVSHLEPQCEAARRMAAALPFPQGPFCVAGHASLEVFVHCEMGDLDRARVALAEQAEVAARHGFDQWTIVATTQREVLDGLSKVGRGEEEAAALAAHAAAIEGYLSLWKMVDQWVFVTYYTTIQAVLHAAAGQRDKAIAALEESLAIAARTGMRFYDAESLRHLANLQEDPAGRTEGLRTALAVARDQGGAVYELRAAMDLRDATGDVAPLTEALARFDADASFPVLDAARARLAGG